MVEVLCYSILLEMVGDSRCFRGTKSAEKNVLFMRRVFACIISVKLSGIISEVLGHTVVVLV